MAAMTNTDNAEREVVEHKVRRALGFKALRDIRRLVDIFDLEQHQQRSARVIAVLALIAFLLVAVSVIAWPPISRLITALFS